MIDLSRGSDRLPPRTIPKTTATPNANQSPLTGLRILLAEDGIDNQRLIAFHLRKAGANVQVADNGKIAVQLMTADSTLDGPLTNPSPFDLILTDMQMPEMDGMTSTRLLRSKGCKIPILALTAHAMATDADACLAAGCNAHLTKPIDHKLLVSSCDYWTKTKEKVFANDLAVCVSEFADDPDLAELITEFVGSFPETVTRIKETLESRCFEDLGIIAHQLKGSGGGYGFPMISDAAGQLEIELKSRTATVSDSQHLSIKRSVEDLVKILELARTSLASRNDSPSQNRLR